MTLKQRLRRAGRKQQGADSRRHDAPHSTPSPASPSGVWMAGFPGTGKATFQTSSRLVEDQPLTTDATRRESAFFDRLVTEEGDFNPFAPRGWNTLARRFTEMVPLTDGMRLLDVGCGTGLSRQIYTNKKTDFVGIDLSAEALRIAAAKFSNDTWLQGDACAIPYDDQQFDVVCFSGVLHHIADFGQALREGYRVLRPGGYVFAYDPNLLHPAMAIFRHPGSWLYSPKGVSPNERPLLPSALAAAFLAAGFSAIRQRCQADLPYRRVAPPLLNALLGFYNCADWLLERSGLGRWFGALTITVGRKRGATPREPGGESATRSLLPARCSLLPASAGRTRSRR